MAGYLRRSARGNIKPADVSPVAPTYVNKETKSKFKKRREYPHPAVPTYLSSVTGALLHPSLPPFRLKHFSQSLSKISFAEAAKQIQRATMQRDEK